MNDDSTFHFLKADVLPLTVATTELCIPSACSAHTLQSDELMGYLDKKTFIYSIKCPWAYSIVKKTSIGPPW